MRRPNILLLVSDEHSFRCFSHLSARDGGEAVGTPALDKLASRSAVFANTYCASPLCVPSRSTLLTGLDAQRAGAWDNVSILDPALDTIPKLLGRAGYTTCLVGKMHFQGRLQFHGFQHRPYGDLVGNGSHQYEMPIPAVPRGEPLRVADDLVARTRDEPGVTKIAESQTIDRIVAEETLAFIRERRADSPDRPWFVCASFSRPHFPLTAPARHMARYRPEAIGAPRVPATGDGYDHPVSRAIRAGFKVDRIGPDEAMRARAAYFACVSYLDEIIADLLAGLDASGCLDDTIVIYTCDHGEMAGEHGTWWKSTWYEASARVPLFISLPQHRRGDLPPRRIATPVSLLDLMPTLAAFAGALPPRDVSGIDLSAAVGGTADPPERPIICDHLNARWGAGTEFRLVRWRNYKLVVFNEFPTLLFDLASDPDEQCDLFSTTSGSAAAARAYLLDVAKLDLDFAAAVARRTETTARLERLYGFDASTHLPNQYLLGSGYVVDADAPIYYPRVVGHIDEGLFGDYPPRGES